MKAFKCPECGFHFTLMADFENMSKDEYEEITLCPCGNPMEEAPLSEDMIPAVNL